MSESDSMELHVLFIPGGHHADPLAQKPNRFGFKVRVGNDYYGGCIPVADTIRGGTRPSRAVVQLEPLVEGTVPESCG